MSLLLAHGHTDAAAYPVAMVVDEAAIVMERVNAEAAGQALMLQTVAATIPSLAVKAASTRKAQTAFAKMIGDLMGRRS